MSSTNDLLNSINSAIDGLSTAEIMSLHPDLARRSVQRQVASLVESGQIIARGRGRGRRYFGVADRVEEVARINDGDAFSAFIPLSADSQDILSYINQPLEARKPVGYQRDFLDAYQPNKTWYLSESLRRQLHKMGKTIAKKVSGKVLPLQILSSKPFTR